MPYLVKFIPYNENTLSALINKTIKFSTVYEFNDFNELGYHGTDCNGNEDRFWKIFEKKFDDSYFRCRFLRNASEAGIYKTEYISDFNNRIKNHTKENPTILLEKDYKFIIENMVFSSIGIFCASALDVFCDDSAQLMFAHYGDNLKGLALIYEISSTVYKKIEYIDGLRFSSGLNKERPMKWLEGDYADMNDFIKKSSLPLIF